MYAIDVTQRKLKFPPRFLPYLEKHRIFELFHECVEILVAVKPKDHVAFLRDIIPCAARKRDKPRIVFIAPPSLDRNKLAQILAECLGIEYISTSYLKFLTQEKKYERLTKAETLGKGESVEEECCVCIEGEQEGEPFRQIYFSGEESEKIVYEESELYYEDDQKEDLQMEGTPPKEILNRPKREAEVTESPISKDHESSELIEDKPCVCVCPCVEEAQKRKKRMAEESTKNFKDTEKEIEEEQVTELTKVLGTQKKKLTTTDGNQHQKPWKSTTKKKLAKIEGGEEEEEWYEEELELPCEPRRPKDKKIKQIFSSQSLSTTSSSQEEIDYELLLSCEAAAKGWILSDFPRSPEEAENLCKLGLLPTHALRIIVNEEEEEKDRDYKWTVFNWKKVYKFVPVMEIKMGKRTIDELSHDLCKLLNIMPHRHAPMLPRVVLIGSRGSGVTTQAQKLAFKYGMVHVEFEVVIAKALQQNDNLAKIYKQQTITRVDPEIEAFILEKTLLSQSCCSKGWVLTGYPTNIDQMRMLDIIATPPNRIIFIEVPAKECFVRLYYRKFDPCFGEEYKLPHIQPFGAESFTSFTINPEIISRLLTHPKNNKKQIISDIETYFNNKKGMMAYCGKTASFVDGNKTVDAVFELIEQIIINPAPAQPPRNPLSINYGINESLKNLKNYRLTSGLLLNNLLLNPPETAEEL